MSAYPEDGTHFLRWLEADSGVPAEPCEFVSRGRYGSYLADVLETAVRRTPWATVRRIEDVVVDLAHDEGRCRLTLARGGEREVDAVVLALGHLGPELSWAPEALVASPRFVADPWTPGGLDAIPSDGDVLLVGTGLTMVDTVLSLDRPGRVVRATSRHGELPRRHVAGLLPAMEAPELPSPTPTLAELRTVMEGHLAKATGRYGDWRPAIDSIRAMTQKLWAALSDADRQEFLALDSRRWDAARHRVPPVSADAIEAARESGRLVLHTASVTDVVDGGGYLDVTLSDGSVHRVADVVNCTGPCGSPQRSTDPLVRSLVSSGLAVPGPLGLGVDTTDDGRLRDDSGAATAPVWTLGSLRRGTLWETTAMPEIRTQAAALAPCLLGPEVERESRPQDTYGLPLSTTPEAADAWCSAPPCNRRTDSSAEQALADAVAADPGFAMAHAALALVGHEWGAEVDIDAALARAVETAAIRADPRERSFVHTVVRRITGDDEVGDRELLRHVNEHPLDALALTVAIPTIAFGGLAQPVEQSWALMETLAPGYGDDWWFAGLLAFVRQEQGRYAEAERLAARSLAAQPASGHAAHALTHVFYETGDHGGGLSWIDRWIADHGPRSSYLAHYSWHAALHELSLDDADAVRRRYAAQLAPSSVTGARALVDSASLLWRTWLAGLWEGELPIGEVLDGVPACLLEHPGTPFGALHAAVGLAAAGDADRIERLGAYAATQADSTFPEVVAPLCAGLSALVRREPERAVVELARVVPKAGRLGGSAAQQEVVLETLVHALVAADRPIAACRLITERLDRRPSPLDRRRRAQLQT
jgi:uncharacterized NAD(P)/FAD-binding protein YdhS